MRHHATRRETILDRHSVAWEPHRFGEDSGFDRSLCLYMVFAHMRSKRMIRLFSTEEAPIHSSEAPIPKEPGPQSRSSGRRSVTGGYGK